jgi:hypothetical protein
MTPLWLALLLFVVFGVSLIAVGGAVLLLEPALAGHPRPPWRPRCWQVGSLEGGWRSGPEAGCPAGTAGISYALPTRRARLRSG